MVEFMDRVARFFDAEYAGFTDDLPLVEAYAQRTGGPLLELGCGTGRLLVPLAKAGYHVTGVDISSEMLRIARAKTDAARLAHRVTLLQGNYVDVTVPGSYGLAFVMMNTFLHLLTKDDQLRALGHWRQCLARDGLLLIDVFHPDVGQLPEFDGRVEWEKTWIEPETGVMVTKFLTRTVNLAEQLIHVNLIYDEIGSEPLSNQGQTQPQEFSQAAQGGGQVRRTLVSFDLRYLWRFEAELLLDKAGFDLEVIYGDLELGPFERSSDRMILIARRRG
jgi:SAM-dependent methyltransferase